VRTITSRANQPPQPIEMLWMLHHGIILRCVAWVILHAQVLHRHRLPRNDVNRRPAPHRHLRGDVMNRELIELLTTWRQFLTHSQ